MAHKKGGGSTGNGRDSNSKRLGVKKFGGEQVLSGNILVAGIRDCARGEDFSAYLNFADEQNPTGVSIVVDASASIVNRVRAPAGRAVEWIAPGVAGLLERVYFLLEDGIAQQYAGTYHAFIRAAISSVADTRDVGVALQLEVADDETLGDFQALFTSEVQYFPAGSGEGYILDMGQITIPRWNIDVEALRIKILSEANDASTNTVWFYDLILVPTDEWAGEFDIANFTAWLLLGKQYVIDSLSDIRESSTMITKASMSPGPEMALARCRQTMVSLPKMLANKKSRVWFFTHIYLEEPPPHDHSFGETAARVKIAANQRYLSMRGNR